MEIKPYLRKAHYHETDQMGVIHHANFIRWFEEARVDFLTQAGYGYEQSIKQGVDFAVTGVSCEYKSMVRFADTVSITLSIAEVTRVRMAVCYEVRNAATGVLCATGTSSHCYVDSAAKRPVSLQKTVPDLYALLREYAGPDA